MLSREQLAQEYINIINQYYPMAGRLLSHCLVKIIKLNSTYNRTYYYNLGIYYPDRIGRHLLEQQDVFRDAAENIGLKEVIFFNANSLIRNPNSTIKQQDFRFWLDLCWIAQQKD
ncbi:hypothetical protein Xen7305DRAFT_00004360 [Xenococcus sp. PCC 7305]|uniref:hypothetical protein n=1 Tax=Xenococcus sp. PCC 7305 TaxID=102125 RepID=UPI0002ACABD1|nr:hypothetical protein [Xenococcus sp. PCC 7305]ELS00735.1 hypothetical protein Xen7305DRAFT_00004360 [Xenococcus sp. PCC 7305]